MTPEAKAAAGKRAAEGKDPVTGLPAGKKGSPCPGCEVKKPAGKGAAKEGGAA